MEKTAPPVQTTSQFIFINIVVSEATTVPLPSTNNTKQFLTIRLLPLHQFLRKSFENLRRYIQSSTSLPSHLPNIHRSNITISNAIAVPLPYTNNSKQFLTIMLLPPLQFLRKLLENSRRYIQSSPILPSHLPKHTLIKHHHFECDCGATAIHRQRHTIPHHQSIASTSILAEIA